jgi:N-acetylglucosamine kinase-like BadF-type ATPase
MDANSSGNRYLAIDSGGTKVAAILYDDDFLPVAAAKSGSLRENSTPAELVERHFSELTEGLGLKPGDRIRRVCGTYGQYTREKLNELFEIDEFYLNGELDMGLAAAGIFGDGLLALSGTGATLFGRVGDRRFASGGYGSAVADEGSGYWIGRQAIIAAIRGREKRGPATALTQLVPRFLLEKAGVCGKKDRPSDVNAGENVLDSDKFRGAIFSIYTDKAHSPVARVASVVPLVVNAAEKGDIVSKRILEEAGELVAEQMIYLVTENGVPSNVPLTVSGSVWKKNRLFYDAFIKKMTGYDPSRKIVLPSFEPVAGAIFKHMFLASRFDSLKARLPEIYADLAYSV